MLDTPLSFSAIIFITLLMLRYWYAISWLLLISLAVISAIDSSDISRHASLRITLRFSLMLPLLAYAIFFVMPFSPLRAYWLLLILLFFAFIDDSLIFHSLLFIISADIISHYYAIDSWLIFRHYSLFFIFATLFIWCHCRHIIYWYYTLSHCYWYCFSLRLMPLYCRHWHSLPFIDYFIAIVFIMIIAIDAAFADWLRCAFAITLTLRRHHYTLITPLAAFRADIAADSLLMPAPGHYWGWYKAMLPLHYWCHYAIIIAILRWRHWCHWFCHAIIFHYVLRHYFIFTPLRHWFSLFIWFIRGYY